MTLRVALPCLAAVMLAVASAHGDIYVWTDAAGIEHYTNSLEGVPEDRRDGAKPFVRERPRAAAEAVLDEIDPEPASPVEAETNDGERLREAYAAGHEAGLALAAPPPILEIMPAPVVQQTAVFVEAPRVEPVIVGSFFPGGAWHRHPHRPPRRHEVDASPFATGPAGPPPLGAAGPPPFAAAGAHRR